MDISLRFYFHPNRYSKVDLNLVVGLPYSASTYDVTILNRVLEKVREDLDKVLRVIH